MHVKSKDFKNFFKEEPSELLKKHIKGLNYNHLNINDKNKYILLIKKFILEKKILKSGKKYYKKWEDGWEENFRLFKKNKNIKDLIPKYLGKYEISRINNKLIKINSKNFDYKIIKIITLYILEKYFKNQRNVVEFGCGTGLNLIYLNKINPKINIIGLDWTISSQKILKLLNKKYKNISGYKFDYFNPKFNKKIRLPKKEWSCFTVASLEQIGGKFKKFIKFLEKTKPNIVVNVEPINEILNKKKILDYLSIKYAEKRNYLKGYYTYLKKLQKDKKIKIIEVKKSPFGNLFMNNFSIICWKFVK
jgi:hypothetical protein